MTKLRFPALRLIIVLSSGCAMASAQAADTVDSVEKAARDWVQIRVETARIENDWRTQKEILSSTVDALSERAKTAEGKRDELKAKTAKDRSEIAAAETKNAAATAGMQVTDAHLKALQARLVQLRPSLPPRLSAALDLAYRSLAEKAPGPSERLQTIMTILNRCVQFNRTITYDEEILSLEGETQPKSLPVLYWGLSQAYALDRTTNRAWRGAPGPQGWQWTALPGAAGAVARLMAVHTGDAEPAFVAVPARLAHPAETPSPAARP